MSVTIADIEFDRVEYDADADVLYLHVGDPSRAVDYDETPEGHAVRFDRDGNLVGLDAGPPEAPPGTRRRATRHRAGAERGTGI